jgi:hypothetical protein
VSEYRLKIKIGNHEFEAEGPAETVAKQFADFKDLIANLPSKLPEMVPHDIVPDPTAPSFLPSPASEIMKIFQIDGRVVSLTAKPSSESEAALLILLGQKALRENEFATGSEIKEGLEQSGYKPLRVDRMMDGFVAEGLVMINGKNRGKKYRLSNPGLAKAQALADDLQRKLP